MGQGCLAANDNCCLDQFPKALPFERNPRQGRLGQQKPQCTCLPARALGLDSPPLLDYPHVMTHTGTYVKKPHKRIARICHGG